MSTVETALGRIGWHELVTPDVERAKKFYVELFGWDTEAFKPGELDYTVISSGGLVGKVTKVVDDDQIEVEIADGVRVRQVRSMITDVRAKGEPLKEESASS